MPNVRDIEQADRLSRRRARMLPVLAVLFITQQASGYASLADGDRLVDHVKVGAWLVLSVVLLIVLLTGGYWFRAKAVRALVDDETTRENRRRALASGFVATMLGAIAICLVGLFKPVGGQQAVHLLMTIGIGAALLQFARFERRALGDG